MTQRLEAAKQAGNEDEVKELSAALQRLKKQWSRYGQNEMSKKKKRNKGPDSNQINGDEMRRQQEALIAEAHQLEDDGKTEEAYALRQRADAIAAQLEDMRRRPKGKKK